jgi:stress-induced morphogen
MKDKATKTIQLINETLQNEMNEETIALTLKLQELEKELG